MPDHSGRGAPASAPSRFEQNLAAARAYYELHGTLAAPRHATALDLAVGQWLTNVRRPGGLGKDPGRARRRAAALAAIDPDWNPGTLGWTVDRQGRTPARQLSLSVPERAVRSCPRRGKSFQTLFRR
ncbi:helicase associated domain-containing protein [Streptomyces sp. NPDC020858]|uniref:helicase associated domain-containing protein n=1 Tax=Streptomyces sp. NPDC020858 TaxID=3365097 RepID=UPI003799C0D9